MSTDEFWMFFLTICWLRSTKDQKIAVFGVLRLTVTLSKSTTYSTLATYNGVFDSYLNFVMVMDMVLNRILLGDLFTSLDSGVSNWVRCSSVLADEEGKGKTCDGLQGAWFRASLRYWLRETGRTSSYRRNASIARSRSATSTGEAVCYRPADLMS